MDKQEIQKQALHNALNSQSGINYSTIINGFMLMGIDMSEIKPRENVFTFNAWKALNRTVKRGQHSVKVVTFIKKTRKDVETGKEYVSSYPHTTTVFHISQTEAMKKH